MKVNSRLESQLKVGELTLGSRVNSRLEIHQNAGEAVLGRKINSSLLKTGDLTQGGSVN